MTQRDPDRLVVLKKAQKRQCCIFV